MNETRRESRAVHLEDYVPVVGAPKMQELNTLAAGLKGRSVQMVNSTSVGGGVAEILSRLVPLLKELGIDVRWDVMTGGNDFFEVTKAFHNALHGAPFEQPSECFEIFLAYNEQNRARLAMDAEFIVIHDPQPAALINGRNNRAGKWTWRCHIDLSQPNPKVWEFLKAYVLRYDGALFSSPDFTQQLPIPQYLFYPSIDPLSEKNRDLEPEFVRGVLERFDIDPKRPILTQISRFDRLKDPVGVVKAYQIVKRYFDCQLVLAGGGAADDPEGGKVLDEVREVSAGDPDIFILDLPPW
ncbi:MAG: glycosyl transferase family 1, partial [Terriglobia bacterium]